MGLFRVLSVIYFTAVCAAQDSADVAPAPNLQLKSGWSEFYASEKVEFSCQVAGSSDWTFTWSKNGLEVGSSDPDVSMDSEGSTLTIIAAKEINSGVYTCTGHHKTNNVTTAASNSVQLTVHAKKPTPKLIRSSNLASMFPGESITFTCSVDESSGWEYLWYHNGDEIKGNTNTYNIASIDHHNGGKYHCKARRGPFSTDESKATTLSISDPPKPDLQLLSPWNEVFEGETVVLSCETESPEWIVSWYRDQKELQGDASLAISDNGPFLNITKITQAQKGHYACKVKRPSRGVSSEFSDTVDVSVYVKQKPKLSQSPIFRPMYAGETVELTCSVDVSSGWEYQWYKDGQFYPKSGQTISITLGPSEGGKYSCKATRGDSTETDYSEEIQLVCLDIPVPTLKQLTPSDVYVGETTQMKCEMNSVSEWTYTWYKNGQKIPEVGAVLTITSASAADAGKYSCQGHLSNRPVNSVSSPELDLSLYEIPVPSLTRVTPWLDVFPDEAMQMRCDMNNVSQWTYTWLKDRQKIQEDGAVLTIKSASAADAGKYTCQGHLSNRPVNSVSSPELHLKVYAKKPTVTLMQTPDYKLMFAGEFVSFTCHINVSSGWAYQWYKDGTLLNGTAKNRKIEILKSADKGSYKCRAKRSKNEHVFFTDFGQLRLEVEENKPKPSIIQRPDDEKVYTGESVSLECEVKGSAGWRYIWYKDGGKILEDSHVFNISKANPSQSGTYDCMAIRHQTTFETERSQARVLNVAEIPVPSVERLTPWSDVFPTEAAKFSCGKNSQSEWTYTWYRDGLEVQADDTVSYGSDRSTLSISSASALHQGQYNCSGNLKSRSAVSSRPGAGVRLDVYDAKPRVRLEQTPGDSVLHTGDSVSFSCHINVSSGWEYVWYKDNSQLTETSNSHNITHLWTAETVSYRCQAKRGRDTVFLSESQDVKLDVKERPQASINLLTGWSDVFSTDSLVLECEVPGGEYQWNYTWYKADQQINQPLSAKHTVTPTNDPEQSLYTCRGVRTSTERPFYSKTSEHFKTKNLLLKRRVLLSISGCLFFGIILVFLGCIALRVFRKPVEDEYKPEETDLFVNMAQLKDLDETPCPLVQYITNASLNAPSKEGEENGTICSETTPLPISSQEEQAVTTESQEATETNGGLISFKQ